MTLLSLTFAYTILRVDLRSVFHGVEGEVYLRDWLLVGDGAHSAFNVLPVIGSRRLLLHRSGGVEEWKTLLLVGTRFPVEYSIVRGTSYGGKGEVPG